MLRWPAHNQVIEADTEKEDGETQDKELILEVSTGSYDEPSGGGS
jgi:hypothetical protein